MNNTQPNKIFYGRGLHLLTLKTGRKVWRLKYRFEGKEKLISLGTVPEVNYEMALERTDAYRDLLAEGINPSEHRQRICMNYWKV